MENMGTWSVDDDHWMEDWMENEENGWLVMKTLDGKSGGKYRKMLD